MVARSYKRGHETYFDVECGIWRYLDTDESILKSERPCKRCGNMPNVEGYDACLGYIIGAKSACCGHGLSEPILIMEKL